MSDALQIQAEFRKRSVRNYGVMTLSASDACEMIGRAKHENVRVLGIDSFVIRGVSIQPFMEHSIDYSARGFFSESDWDDAIAFIQGKASLGLVFEVVLGDSVPIGNVPNHLPDPTSPSVTPAAGAAGAPSVAADH
jgi:hypothetical protein